MSNLFPAKTHRVASIFLLAGTVDAERFLSDYLIPEGYCDCFLAATMGHHLCSIGVS